MYIYYIYIPGSSKGFCLKPKGWCIIRHPQTSSIQHHLEDPGMHIIYVMIIHDECLGKMMCRDNILAWEMSIIYKRLVCTIWEPKTGSWFQPLGNILYTQNGHLPQIGMKKKIFEKPPPKKMNELMKSTWSWWLILWRIFSRQGDCLLKHPGYKFSSAKKKQADCRWVFCILVYPVYWCLLTT